MHKKTFLSEYETKETTTTFVDEYNQLLLVLANILTPFSK